MCASNAYASQMAYSMMPDRSAIDKGARRPSAPRTRNKLKCGTAKSNQTGMEISRKALSSSSQGSKTFIKIPREGTAMPQ
ncbi:hypothetical protein TNCV_866771 [Trichonephila clavipes]|nr:hypothetical protein TNCV_866771 [Trichonephila clavipes]